MSEIEKFQPSAAIFDMDGLMLDTERPGVARWVETGKCFGWDIKPELIIRTLGIDKEGTRAIIIDEMGPEFPFDKIRDETHRRMNEDEEKGINHRPGLVVLLDHLASLGIPRAVATSTRREAALRKLRKADILDRFTVLACGDEVTNGKPAPDIFLLAAERLGKAPSECIGFEDSPAGLRGLHAAGIRSVFVKDLADPPPDVMATVWRRCADLAEAVELFK